MRTPEKGLTSQKTHLISTVPTTDTTTHSQCGNVEQNPTSVTVNGGRLRKQ